jgi:cytochrome b
MTQRDPASSQGKVVIWDSATRIFHWALVAFVCINLFFIDPEGGVTTVIHFVSGFAIIGLLIFRILWGFVGSHYARFTDFIYSPSKTIEYGRQLLKRRPQRFLGHNPLGGWMVVVLLAVLTAMAGTGLFASSRRAAGPLAHLATASQSATASFIHSVLSNVLIILIVGHLAGLVFDWIITRENLVGAMFTGRKLVLESDLNPALVPAWRAAIVALAAIAVSVVLIATTDYGATRDTLRAISN